MSDYAIKHITAHALVLIFGFSFWGVEGLGYAALGALTVRLIGSVR